MVLEELAVFTPTNRTGQIRNNYVLQYFMWRTLLTGGLACLSIGTDSKVGNIDGIAKVVNHFAVVNSPQLVSTMERDILFAAYK